MLFLFLPLLHIFRFCYSILMRPSADKFDIIGFVKKLLEFSPRLGINERKTAEFLISVLKSRNIEHSVQEFEACIPLAKKAFLAADGKKIDCLASCFVGGEISGKASLISSLIPTRYCLDYPNINFNPESKAISLSNFYFAPSVAVNAKDVARIINAKKIRGEVEIEPYRYSAWNILAGNAESPKAIVFAHYDSIETGACDNASGTGVVMSAMIANPKLLYYNLFVFSANEELSYDKPVYWGHGFRAFEKKYKNIMGSAGKLIAVDCAGNAKNTIDRNERMAYLAFPIANSQNFKDKIFSLYGDLEKETGVYHSAKDDISQVSKKWLDDASKLLTRELTNMI